jgi:hypothetical protein
VTDPTGLCFLSYRRLRAAEAHDLARRLKARGIPLWVDISDLGSGSTEDQLIDALENERCAGGVVWLTPEVVDSPVIRRVEVPKMVERVRRRDGFFGVMALAGGLDYARAAEVAAENLGTDDLSAWNMERVEGDPAVATELDRVADIALRQRLAAVTRNRPGREPLRVGVWVRRSPPRDSDSALELDWHESFSGRQASVGAWDAELLPALKSVHEELARTQAGVAVVVHGHPTLAAAVALGRAFPAVAGIPLAWEQVAPDATRCQWSLSTTAESSGYDVTTRSIKTEGDGLAVLVSTIHDAGLAFGATTGLPSMRASIEVVPSAGGRPGPLTAGGALELAHAIAQAVRTARAEYRGVRQIHLFFACPVGLAIIVGQLLNAVGPMTVYEYIDDDAIGHYVPELRLPPSGLG